ncbi:hypothetical protein [Hydrogenovibrio marinus]|uniref:Uncharacterized protein n=1 Tax=Hydrogenovibrio marinus TaxID=28885 RepID=A0A066ZWZ0_HYDMR|nr:hypothetical protein [Hydrogenovibrio marinus]KDN94615.1 hypothetical protein EI16_11975 [Hydrogenovibrio marinus]
MTILFSAIIGAGVSVFFFESQGVPRSDFTLHWAFLGGLISAVSSIATVVFIYFAPFGVAGKKRESLRALNSEISTLEKDKGVK